MDEEQRRQMTPAERLDRACARVGATWRIDTARGEVVVLRDEQELGRAGGSLDAAARAHEVILAALPASARILPVMKVRTHPVLCGIGGLRTKLVDGDESARAVVEYIEAGMIDPDRRAVRVAITTDPRDRPADCAEEA